MSNPTFFLGPTSFAKLIAPSIKDDITIAAASAALDPVLQKTIASIPNLLLWARLSPASNILSPAMQRLVDFAKGFKPLSDAELELLAWQEHVDFWQPQWARSIRENLVRTSTEWHRLKGTPAGMKMAFALFNMSISITEGGHGVHWASYQLGFENITNVKFVRQAWNIALEMQPARCQLFRMYTDEYNITPLIYSEGNYSDHFYSFFSGVPATDIGDDWQGDEDLQLSFGVRHLFETARLEYINSARFFGLARQGFEAPYIDHPVWSYFAYSDAFPQKHGFIISQLLCLDWCEKIYSSGTWQEGTWADHPWAKSHRWDRRLPSWRMFNAATSRSQLVYLKGRGHIVSGVESNFPTTHVGEDYTLLSENCLRLASNATSALQCDTDDYGCYSGLNSCYSVPIVIREGKPFTWSDSNYSDDTEFEQIILHELKHDFKGTSTSKCSQKPISSTMTALLSLATPPLHNNTWSGTWDEQRTWYDYVGYFAVKSIY